MSLQAWKRDLRVLQGVNLSKVDATLKAARGIIDDNQIDRAIEFREASFDLFEQGNSVASMWAGQAMWEAVNFLDSAMVDRRAIRAGRTSVTMGIKGTEKKVREADAIHAIWQAQADAFWSEPQHRNKTKAEVARQISKKRKKGENPHTIRKAIKKPVITGDND